MTLSRGLFTSNDSTWTTPKDFFDKLDQEFHFTMDAAALSTSTLVKDNWLGPDHPLGWRKDALTVEWTGATDGWIWLNPPYGRAIKDFMRKAHEEVQGGAKVVALVPARTDTVWWHSYVIQYEVRFIKGRLKFGGSKQGAPFPSAVVVMK